MRPSLEVIELEVIKLEVIKLEVIKLEVRGHRVSPANQELWERHQRKRLNDDVEPRFDKPAISVFSVYRLPFTIYPLPLR